MDRVTSLDELEKIKQECKDELFNNLKQEQLVKEALNDSRCIVLYTSSCVIPFKIIVSVPSYASRNKFCGREIYGFYISLFSDEICIWFAVKDGASFMDSLSVGTYSYNMSLDEIINEALNDAEICDYCHKKVGIENLSQIAFANKSCPDCKEKAIKKDMGPGWCD